MLSDASARILRPVRWPMRGRTDSGDPSPAGAIVFTRSIVKASSAQLLVLALTVIETVDVKDRSSLNSRRKAVLTINWSASSASGARRRSLRRHLRISRRESRQAWCDGDVHLQANRRERLARECGPFVQFHLLPLLRRDGLSAARILQAPSRRRTNDMHLGRADPLVGQRLLADRHRLRPSSRAPVRSAPR